MNTLLHKNDRNEHYRHLLFIHLNLRNPRHQINANNIEHRKQLQLLYY